MLLSAVDLRHIIVTIDADEMTSPLEFRFPINNVSLKKGLYNYARTENASTKSFKFDTKTGKMTFEQAMELLTNATK